MAVARGPGRPLKSGGALRRLRLRVGPARGIFSVADLARVTGYSMPTLSWVERGKQRPSLQLLAALAGAYHLTLDQVVSAYERDQRRRPK